MLPATDRPRGLRRVLGLLAGPLVATLVFFAAGEVLARAFDVVDRLNGYTRLLFAASDDPRVPYRLRPGVTTTFGSPVPAHVNALGFRGPEKKPGPPAPGVERILVLGDSVVFGQGVGEDEMLTARLAAELAARGRRVEVVNAGVPGYNAETDAGLLAAVGPDLHPTQVVVGLHVNDYDPPPRRDALGILRRTDQGPWLAHSEFAVLLGWLWRWARGELWQQRFLDAPPASTATVEALDRWVAETHRRFYANPDPEGWRRLTDGLAALRDESARLGAPLLVALLPEGWQMDGSQATGEPQRRLLAACAQARVRCLDLRPAFVGHGGALFFDTQHPNAEGHAIIGRALAYALTPAS